MNIELDEKRETPENKKIITDYLISKLTKKRMRVSINSYGSITLIKKFNIECVPNISDSVEDGKGGFSYLCLTAGKSTDKDLGYYKSFALEKYSQSNPVKIDIHNYKRVIDEFVEILNKDFFDARKYKSSKENTKKINDDLNSVNYYFRKLTEDVYNVNTADYNDDKEEALSGNIVIRDTNDIWEGKTGVVESDNGDTIVAMINFDDRGHKVRQEFNKNNVKQLTEEFRFNTRQEVKNPRIEALSTFLGISYDDIAGYNVKNYDDIESGNVKEFLGPSSQDSTDDDSVYLYGVYNDDELLEVLRTSLGDEFLWRLKEDYYTLSSDLLYAVLKSFDKGFLYGTVKREVEWLLDEEEDELDDEYGNKLIKHLVEEGLIQKDEIKINQYTQDKYVENEINLKNQLIHKCVTKEIGEQTSDSIYLNFYHWYVDNMGNDKYELVYFLYDNDYYCDTLKLTRLLIDCWGFEDVVLEISWDNLPPHVVGEYSIIVLSEEDLSDI